MSNQEKVARAVDGLDWESQHGGIDPSNEQIATAAIDALADVDGIAGVLRARAEHDERLYDANELTLDEAIFVDMTHGDDVFRIEGDVREIAAAVVAWMKDAL